MQKFKPAKLYDAGGDLSQRWFVFYYFKSPDTGKPIRFRHWISSKIMTGSGRRDKAHELIRTINAKLRKGFNPFAYQERKYNSISVAMKYVLSIKENSCRKRTHHTYSSMIRQFNEWLEKNKLTHLTIDDFNYYHAQQYMDYTQATLKNGNRTYNNRVTAMKTIFKVLVSREWILDNPFDKIERLPEEDPGIIAFSNDDLVTMQKYLPAWNYDLYACACLIFYCFIRPQELVRLKVSDFHISKRAIVIPGKVSKNKKQEVVQIPDPLLPILNKLDLRFPGHFFVFGKNQKRGTTEYAPTRMAEAWKEFAEKYGIQKNIYSLKHTGVGMALENGINIRDLQLQLRHSSLEMTQIYLDKFNSKPSTKLSTHFPDLAQLTKDTMSDLRSLRRII